MNLIKISSEHPGVSDSYRELFVAMDPAEAIALIRDRKVSIIIGDKAVPEAEIIRQAIEQTVAAGGTVYVAQPTTGHWPGTYFARSWVEGEARCTWCSAGLARPDSPATAFGWMEVTPEESCRRCRRTLEEIAEVNSATDEHLAKMYVGDHFHLPSTWPKMAHLLDGVAERIRVIRRARLREQIAEFVWCTTCGAPATNVLCQPFAPDYAFCDAHKRRGQRHWSGQESSGRTTLEGYLLREIVGLHKLTPTHESGATAEYYHECIIRRVVGPEPGGFVAVGSGYKIAEGPSSGEGGYLYSWQTEAAFREDLGKWIAEARATHSPKTESIIFS